MPNESLKVKPMTKELKSKFCKHLCEIIATKCKLDVTFNATNGIHNFVYFSNEEYSADDVLNLLNESLPSELVTFIETETGENAKEYDRSIALFESTTSEVNLTITW